MEKERKIRRIAVFTALAFLVVLGFFLSITIGNVSISFKDAMLVLTGNGDFKNAAIITDIRLPRVIMTFILGGALAVSGFLLQTYFANPIAGPYILGISSGAKMAVAVLLIFITTSTGRTSSMMLVLAAFVGAVISTFFIIMISRAVRNMGILLAAGIMIGYICSAITDFLIAFADDSDIVNLHGWSQGSFSGTDMGTVKYAAGIVFVTLVSVMLLSKALDALRLGETYARSVGVNVKVCRVLVILFSSVLSACVTAFAGPISFIGIAVPFLVRELLKSSKPIVLVPASFLAGSVFCMFSDLLARQMFAPTELNISAVTSLFGAPIVIYMMVRRRGNHET
ncbi:MAG: iron ABC transporter permease [Butyrivibrio sp.]|nr:iron ABC transporter permease [Butyrivibrio sp.]MBR1641440.1 iron ABC transporter permease [Butyrivibrio sp.]